MTDQKAESVGLLGRIKVKGRDFDRDGTVTPQEELFQMPGLFKLKDVHDRIPIDLIRLKYWYSNPNGPYFKCFTKISMGERRSLVFVDLMMLNTAFEKNSHRGPMT